jgi:hypothetical protein
MALWLNYSTNLHYWFGAGGQNDFTPVNPLHFQLVNSQVVFYQLSRSSSFATFAASGCFLVGIALWVWNQRRSAFYHEGLALASLLALSLLPFYHRSYDLGVLVFALGWALTQINGPHRTSARAIMALYCVLLLPGQSALARLQPHLPLWASSSWWWNLVLAPHAAWVLLAINVVLLYAFLTSAVKYELQNEVETFGVRDAIPA